ncbi:LysR family transcriptional regulator [Bordetella genomosp. 9]|uniref:LysR family transcriptional regulator n=1 Tax=Bordetella genomosp. 9 TaxID=1416803 RepID=A0A261R1B0_9BORD|nr:LysR family transcriptional regulator [Bordetella genomosp. 9]OZI18828.1 LysR family transcriptional regulator [Bordetella genomosp. 9]
MIKLDDLALFVRSAALGSFSDVAREADLLPGQVSAAIKRLEGELDARLFARSTRSLRLTAEGEAYLPHAQTILDNVRAGHEELHGQQRELRGVLQVAAPSDLGRNVLLPWFTLFRQPYPRLTLKLFFSDRVTDVFRDPVDVAVRYSVAEDASYVALPLAPENRRVLVASFEYLSRRGVPSSLDDLASHDCLLYMLSSRLYDKWEFRDGKNKLSVNVTGTIHSDDGDVVRRLALAGEGIAYKSWMDVSDDVRTGRLHILLPHLSGVSAPLMLVCPHRKQYSPGVQALYRLLKERCEAVQKTLPAPPR